MDRKKYSPLPEYLAIGPSQIHGAGIIASDDIPAGINMGITHIYDPEFQDDYIRTPLGGFINHSDKPNCEIREDESKEYREVFTLKKIEMGEEITVTYKLYNL